MTMKEFMENGTQEQIEKLRACKTAEELLALTKEFGIDLDEAQAEELVSLFQASNGEITDEALELVTGGRRIDWGQQPTSLTLVKGNPTFTCRICGSHNASQGCERGPSGPSYYVYCKDCKQRS